MEFPLAKVELWTAICILPLLAGSRKSPEARCFSFCVLYVLLNMHVFEVFLRERNPMTYTGSWIGSKGFFPSWISVYRDTSWLLFATTLCLDKRPKK